LKDDSPTFYPPSAADWRQWLATNHASETSVWVIFYKTASDMPSMSWSEAVDEALCFGWIDGIRKTLDEDRFIQRFSKRKIKTTWSKINKDKVTELIASKRMTKAGLAAIEEAKENGSWNVLDAIEALEVPQDLVAALQQHQGAHAYFEELSKSKKKMILYWVTQAKRPETREKRIRETVEQATQQQLPKHMR
jgi:uncharacterized protein YdeI (YjbR/CyaY-like superfamily)